MLLYTGFLSCVSQYIPLVNSVHQLSVEVYLLVIVVEADKSQSEEIRL